MPIWKSLIMLLFLITACSTYEKRAKYGVKMQRCDANGKVTKICIPQRGMILHKLIVITKDACNNKSGTLPTNAAWVADNCSVNMMLRF